MADGTRRWSLFLRCLCLGLAGVIILNAPDATAQVLYGSVVGDVTDATGAALPGTILVITNRDTGLTRQAAADAQGHFNSPICPRASTA